MWASLHYEPPVSNMIHALKHLADLSMVQPLADLMMQNPPDRLADECFDFVLPVPLSRERLLQRGFNQSESIVGLLAQRYGWQILPRHTVFRHHRRDAGRIGKDAEKIRRKPHLLLDAGTHANEKITKFFDTPSALWQGYAPISD